MPCLLLFLPSSCLLSRRRRPRPGGVASLGSPCRSAPSAGACAGRPGRFRAPFLSRRSRVLGARSGLPRWRLPGSGSRSAWRPARWRFGGSGPFRSRWLFRVCSRFRRPRPGLAGGRGFRGSAFAAPSCSRRSFRRPAFPRFVLEVQPVFSSSALVSVFRRTRALSGCGCVFSAGVVFVFACPRRAFLVVRAFRRRGLFAVAHAVSSAPGLLSVVVAPAPVSPSRWPVPGPGGGGFFFPAGFPGGVGRFSVV